MNINMKNSLFLSVAAALSIMSTGCADATETPAEAAGSSTADDAADMTDASDSADMSDALDGTDGVDTTDGADSGDTSTGRAATALASCYYVNGFSQADECKEYTGANWTIESATDDCKVVFPGTAGEFREGVSCQFEAELGRCEIGDPSDSGYLLVSEGGNPDDCALAQTGCETFGGGAFTPILGVQKRRMHLTLQLARMGQMGMCPPSVRMVLMG